MRLRDKVCVLTGTGGSIGRAAALRFAGEGALVVGCDVSPESAEETARLVETSGGQMVSLHPAELGTVRDGQRVIDLAVREFGRVDVLFTNAAMAHRNHKNRANGTDAALSLPHEIIGSHGFVQESVL